jgi:hypothetical protein
VIPEELPSEVETSIWTGIITPVPISPRARCMDFYFAVNIPFSRSRNIELYLDFSISPALSSKEEIENVNQLS